MEAQRYPDDFDGIIAGAAANPKTHLDALAHLDGAGDVARTRRASSRRRSIRRIHQAVLAACDALDGVKDGLIENPTRCQFDPGVLACKGARRSDLSDRRRRWNPRAGRS